MKEVILARPDFGAAFRKAVEDSERDSRFIQAMIDASASSIVILDEDRTILFANRAWRQFAASTGSLAGAYGIGETYPDVFTGVASKSPEDSAAIRRGLVRLIHNDESEFQMKYRCIALARPMWILMHAAVFVHPGADHRRMILVTHDDVSAAEFASDEWRKDEERFGRLLKTTNILPWEARAGNTQFTYIGEQAGDLLGYSADEWKREGFWASHIHPADRERVVTEYATVSRTQDHFRSQYRMIAKDGRVVWIEDIVDVVREWSKPPTMHGFMMDISTRKLAEFVLADLSRRLINAQEDERKRIARELHDDLNQRIALISIELERVAQLSVNGSACVPARLTNLKKQVSEISNEIHRMSYELHPSKLDHLGLAPALNSFCTDVARSRGIKVEFRRESVPAELPRDVTLCIYRVAQEALQNAAKHSGADKVVVALKGSDRTLELVVTDHGNGFAATAEKMTKGLGVTSMQERVRHVGGQFSLVSAPSRGTVLSVTVPIDREEEAN